MILLDTNAFLFDALAPDRLSEAARTVIELGFAEQELCILDVTLTEVAWLATAGRIELGGSVAAFLTTALAAREVVVLPVTPMIAERAAQLSLHKDPADRLIAAATMVHGGRLVTSDRRLLEAPGIDAVW